MWRLRWCLARLSNFLRPGRADVEMSREMASHLAMLEDEYRRRGLDPSAAKRAARERFGTEARMHDLHRDARSPLWLEQLRQDLRYTLRSLVSNKTYAAISILTLGLGIGANSAVFSVVHPLLIEPLPFDNPEQIVQLLERGTSPDWTDGGARGYPLPPARLAELEAGLTSFDGTFQAYSFRTTLFDPGEPSSALIAGVSEGAFTTLRTQPLHGRLLGPADHQPGAAPVAVATHAARQRYWGEADAIGSTVAIDLPTGRQRFTIVGVLSEDFDLSIGAPSAPTADFWLPGDFSGHGTGSGLTTILRVRDGAGIAAASAEIESLLRAMGLRSYRLDLASGELRDGPVGEAALVPLKERELERMRIAFVVLIAIVGVVLLIACMNVASLMLGRGTARRRELAIRASIGASRSRLVRQVLTESLALGTAGGIAGIVVAWGAVRLLVAWPGNLAGAAGSAPFVALPRLENIEVDGAVLAFTVAVSLITGVLCGITPALSVGKDVGLDRVNRGSLAPSSSRVHTRGRSVLIVSQIALAMVLLVCAGLLMNSFLRLAGVDPGFDTEDVITFQVTASREHFRQTEPFGGGVAYFEALAEDIRRLPGVAAAGYGPPPFLFGSGNGISVDVPGSASGSATVSVLDIGDGYLEALGVPVLQGRGLGDRDGTGAPLVMLVNEAFVRQHKRGRNPLGMRVGTSMAGRRARPRSSVSSATSDAAG